MTTPDPKAGGWRTRWHAVRSRFRALWLVPVLAFVALGCWAFSSPIGSAPDDDFHLTSIWCANGDRADLCREGSDSQERLVSTAIVHVTCYVGDPQNSAECQEQYLDLPATPDIPSTRGSFDHQYPPVYYGFMNLFASPDLQVSALVMRLVNVLLFVGVTVALYLLLPVARRAVLFGMWLLTSVPLGVFLIASDNPSSWALIGVGTSWLAMLGFFETAGRRRILLGGLAVLTSVMAAGARGDAAVYVVLGFGIAAVLGFRHRREFYLSLILPAVLAVVAAAFFLTSQQSGVTGTGLGTGTPPPGPLDLFGLTFNNLASVPFLWTGVFGTWGLGWLDTAMPPIVWVAALSAFVGVLFLTMRAIPRRLAILLALLALVLWLLPTYVLVRGFNVVGENVQPRYLLPLIVVFAGLALLPWRRGPVVLSRAQATMIAVGLSGAHLLALHLNIRRYVTGIEVQSPNLDAGAEWWWPGFPLSPVAVWVIGSVAFSALAVILVREMRNRVDVIS